MIKKILIFIYLLLLVVMGVTTFLEHFIGTAETHALVYGSWWFVALWALLVLAGSYYLLRQLRHKAWNFRKVNILAIHFSFVVILLGALITHVASRQGIIHLRGDQPTNQFVSLDADGHLHTDRLPFYVKLDRFDVSYHKGTLSPADYETRFSILTGGQTLHAKVSMNKIFSYRHYRLYQASYDTDNKGSYLSVNHDPWGIGITYTGYALLFLSLLGLLADPRGTFRQLLRSDMLRRGALGVAVLLALGLPTDVHAASAPVTAPVVSQDVADSFGRLYIDYNGRICPMQTFAIDFVTKLHGSSRYHRFSAVEVLASWTFYPKEWANEPVLRLKSAELRDRFHLPEYTSVHAFFGKSGYLLGPLVEEYREGAHDALHRAAAEMDDRLMLVMMLQQGSAFKLFPYTAEHTLLWYSRADSLPADMPHIEKFFVRNVFPIIQEQLLKGNDKQAQTFIDKLRKYQQLNGGDSLPTPLQVRAERFYNEVPIPSVLFICNIVLGLLLLYVLIRCSDKAHRHFLGVPFKGWVAVARGLLLLSLLALTLTLTIRGIVSNSLPMANGYDTMLLLGWLVMALMLLASYSFKGLRLLTCSFGFLLSGFFLLVSHLNVMNPAIGHLMPVLNSPLLSIHVSIIMFGFALLTLTFLCGIYGLLVRSSESQMHHLSLLLLYPAIVTLAIGIFIGAVWANISWGNYWTWDPKETWALITLMVYAVPLHAQSLPPLQRPRGYHWYMVIAFLTLIMTYFGVNYFMVGMHSYA